MSNVAIMLGDWVENIGTRARGCPLDFVFDNLCRAAREVCAETSVWKEEIRVPVAAGVGSVLIDSSVLPGGTSLPTAVHTLLSASVDGRRLRVALQDIADWMRPDSTRPGSGDIQVVAMRDADALDVYPAPDKNTTVVLHVSCTPVVSRDAWLPEHVATTARDAIEHATLARLFDVAETPWASPELAGYHARQAVLAKAKLRVRDKTGAVAGSVMTRMQPFGA